MAELDARAAGYAAWCLTPAYEADPEIPHNDAVIDEADGDDFETLDFGFDKNEDGEVI